jgi:hypothetical protein
VLQKAEDRSGIEKKEVALKVFDLGFVMSEEKRAILMERRELPKIGGLERQRTLDSGRREDSPEARRQLLRAVPIGAVTIDARRKIRGFAENEIRILEELKIIRDRLTDETEKNYSASLVSQHIPVTVLFS